MIWSSNGGKSDAWTGQEWGQSTIPLHSNSKLDIPNNTNRMKRFLFKNPKTFYSLYDRSFYETAITPNPGRSFPHWPLSMSCRQLLQSSITAFEHSSKWTWMLMRWTRILLQCSRILQKLEKIENGHKLVIISTAWFTDELYMISYIMSYMISY